MKRNVFRALGLTSIVFLTLGAASYTIDDLNTIIPSELMAEIVNSSTISQNPDYRKETLDILSKLAEEKGYSAAIHYLDEGNDAKVTFGICKNMYWYIHEDEGQAVVSTPEYTSLYSYKNKKWRFVGNTPLDEDITPLILEYQSTLVCGYNYYGFKRLADQEVSGRMCEVYENEVSALGIDATVNLYIDKTYKILMKCEAKDKDDATKVSAFVSDFVVEPTTPKVPQVGNYSFFSSFGFDALFPEDFESIEEATILDNEEAYSFVYTSLSKDEFEAYSSAFVAKFINTMGNTLKTEADEEFKLDSQVKMLTLKLEKDNQQYSIDLDTSYEEECGRIYVHIFKN